MRRLPRSCRIAALALVLVGLSGATGRAQEEQREGWQYEFTPMYLWGVSVSGDMTVRSSPASPTVPLDVEFKDAVQDLSGIFTVHFEARKARWGYYGDFSYLRLTPESQLPTGQTVNVDFRNPLVEAAGMYRLGAAADSPWWVVGGLRYMRLSIDVTGIPSPPLPFAELDVSKNLTDVFGGIRYRRRFSERWTAFAQGDIGTGSSDLTWAATLYASYQVHQHASVLGGWRWLDYRVRESSLDLDMLLSGPLIGLQLHW